MRVSFENRLAIHFGLQQKGDSRNGIVLNARAKSIATQILGSELATSVCRSSPGRRETGQERIPKWPEECLALFVPNPFFSSCLSTSDSMAIEPTAAHPG